jgi:hypothetical protein
LPRKQARLDDSSPSHINHIDGQVCLKRVFVLSRSSDKSRSMSISKTHERFKRFRTGKERKKKSPHSVRRAS